MATFEIVRDDDVVVYYEAQSRQELEEEYLLLLRVENPDKSYAVYKVDENLTRIGNSKKYKEFDTDDIAQKEWESKGSAFFDILKKNGLLGRIL